MGELTNGAFVTGPPQTASGVRWGSIPPFLLLVPTRRLPPADPAIEIFGEQALLTHWLEHTPF